MYKRRFKGKREFAGKSGLQIGIKKWEGGYPEKPSISKESQLLEAKSFRDLQFQGSLDIKADPNTEAARGNYPYAILNKTNRVVDANYPGFDNLAGNSIVRLQNSGSSQFLNLFDTVAMIKRLNYLYFNTESELSDGNYVPLKDGNSVNAAFGNELVKAIEQAVSYGYSTMLTQLPFYTDTVESDLPRIGGLLGASDDSYDRLGALMHYQTVLQNLVSPIGKYTELLSMEEDLMNMSFRREAPLIQEIFGQLKKKAFIAKLNAIGTTVIGEYFDLNWYRQANALRHIPSRKSNDMNNPIITMITTHKIPHIKLYNGKGAGKVKYYDSADQLKYVNARGFEMIDPETFEKVTLTEIDLETCVLNVSKFLDAHYLLTWCRQRNSGLLSASAIKNTSAYYQAIVNYLEIISLIAAVFGTNMTEIRTFIDKMAQTHMVYWNKGVSFDISVVKPVPLTYNQVAADVLKATLSGAYDLTFDAGTLRWVCDTEWDMYTGISEYDRKSGGAFLTFGLRKINNNDSQGVSMDYDSSNYLIPIMFDATPVVASQGKILDTYNSDTEAETTHRYPAYVWATTRAGFRVELFIEHIDNADLNESNVLCRLNPLAKGTLSIKAPTWIMPTGLSVAEFAHLACMMHKLLLQVAGYDALITNVEQVLEDETTTYVYTVESMCDDDIVCFLDLQIEDVSNAMITFARNYSPFRVSTPDGKRTVGFGQ